MKNKKLYIILGAVFAALLITAAILYPKLSKTVVPDQPELSVSISENATVTLPSAGDAGNATESFPKTASDFVVFDAAGKEVRLSDFKGKPVIINFWASWCPPCRAELPYFNAVYEEYGDQIVFLMVDLTDGERETQSSAEALLRENNYTFPVYFDLAGAAAKTYQLYSIPQTVAADAEGNLVYSQVGSLQESTVRQLVDLLIG